MRNPLLIILLILIGSPFSKAQDFKTIDQSLIWMGASAALELPDDFKLKLLFEERRFIFPDREQQRVIPDLQLSKSINEHFKANLGLWVFSIFQPGTPFEMVERTLFEWRPYFSIAYQTASGPSFWTFTATTEYRLFKQLGAEHHFDKNISQMVVRERLKAQYSRQLSKQFSLHLYEELHLNLASDVEFQSFNQNRLGIYGTYQLMPALSASIGYLYWFQPTGNAAEYFSRHIITSGLSYTFKGQP